MKLAVILCAAVALTPPLAHAADARRFDYACEGQSETRGEGLAAGRTRFIDRFRIDLEAGRWCRGGCRRTLSIRRVSPERIVLDDESSGDLQVSDVIDRRRKTFAGSVGAGSASSFRGSLTKARCELVAFTRFPQ